MELIIVQNTAELERLEGVITRNLQSFYQVGRALAEIRDRGYYRDVLGFETFEGYCKAKWDFTGRYARTLMASSEVIENLSGTIVPVSSSPKIQIPATESQCRPLARLEPDQQREAWQQAVDTAPEGKVTAAIVAKVVKEMTAPDKTKTIKIKPKPKEVKSGELMSERFKVVWEALLEEIKNEKHLKWKTTSKEAALQSVNVLIDVITIK